MPLPDEELDNENDGLRLMTPREALSHPGKPLPEHEEIDIGASAEEWDELLEAIAE